MNQLTVNEDEVLNCVRDGHRLETSGNQARIYVGSIQNRKVLIKAVTTTGIASRVCRWLLRREYRVYQALDGVSGIPCCYGLFQDRFLVLEHIESQTMRNAFIRDRARFFEEFKSIIESLHERHVTHGDLKRKDNILVVNGERPCLVDFGVSTIRRRGLHPIHKFWYAYSRQHDYNAWVKHKYGGRLQNISQKDAEYYRPMRIEKLARRIKRFWTRVKNGMKGILTTISAS